MAAFFVLCILLMEAFSQTTTKSYPTNESGCVWNCTIFDSTFGKKVKAPITDERVVKLYVKNPVSVDKHCVNQTESKEPSQVWIWQIDNSESESASVIVVGERFSWVVWPKNALKEQTEARLSSCTLNRPSISASNLRRISFRNRIALLYIPVNTADPTGRFLGIWQIHNATLRWPRLVLQMSAYPIWISFLFYFPAIVCIFSSVVAEERGSLILILDGPSLMGFRGCVGKLFFPRNWRIPAYIRVCFVASSGLVLCALLIVCILTNSLLTPYLNTDHYYLNTYLSCFVLFAFRTFCVFLIPALSFSRPCLVCQFAGVRHIRKFNCQSEVRQHLRVQPLIFMQFLVLFSRGFLAYCSAILLVRPSCNAFIRYPVQVFGIIVWLVFFLPVMLLITALCIFLCLFLSFCSSPLVTFFDLVIESMKCRTNLISRVLSPVVVVSVSFSFCTIYFDFIFGFLAVNAIEAIRMLVMNLNEILPYVALSVLVLYYLWSCYSAFTSKYQELALALYKHYKTDHGHLQPDKIMKIPKDLFDMASEELMPVRHSVCIFLLKVVSIVLFVVIVFAVVISTGAPPVTQAVVAFFSGTFPKVVEVFYGAGRQRGIETVALDERVQHVVREYSIWRSFVDQANQNTRSPRDDENTRLINLAGVRYGTVDSFTTVEIVGVQ